MPPLHIPRCNGGIRRLIHRRKTAFLGRSEMHPVWVPADKQVNAKVGFEPVTTPVWVFCAESNCGIRTRDPMQCDRAARSAQAHSLVKCH